MMFKTAKWILNCTFAHPYLRQTTSELRSHIFLRVPTLPSFINLHIQLLHPGLLVGCRGNFSRKSCRGAKTNWKDAVDGMGDRVQKGGSLDPQQQLGPLWFEGSKRSWERVGYPFNQCRTKEGPDEGNLKMVVQVVEWIE